MELSGQLNDAVTLPSRKDPPKNSTKMYKFIFPTNQQGTRHVIFIILLLLSLSQVQTFSNTSFSVFPSGREPHRIALHTVTRNVTTLGT